MNQMDRANIYTILEWIFYSGISSVNFIIIYIYITLILIGMRQGTFHPLSFLDQTLSAEFLTKKFQIFFEVKIRINLTPWQAH
jgi:hypothetical protein